MNKCVGSAVAWQRISREIVALSGILAFAVVVPAPASASLIVGTGAAQFAVLGEPTNDQTNFNNGTISGDIGIGTPRQFTISNANVVGNIRFSGATNTSGLIPDPDPNSLAGPFSVSGGGTVTGNVVANDSAVLNAITYINDLSQALGANAGTNTTVTAGGSINAAAGALGSTASVDGNPLGTYRVFNVTSVNFPNGIFTINGSATDQVVLNVAFSANFHGEILLTGGIIPDSVVINMFGGNPATLSGGPTLDVNTNGLSTFGTFIDPFGSMSAVNTDIQGRFFGGDSVNQQIVAGADITAPGAGSSVVPEPASLALVGLGLAGLGALRRRHRGN